MTHGRMHVGMMVLGILVCGVVGSGGVGAQGVSTIQANEGRSGTVIDLGNGIQTFDFPYSQGRSQSGSIITFPPASEPFSGSSRNFSSRSGRDRSRAAPVTPAAPLPPLVPLTSHTVVTPGFAPHPSSGGVGTR